jgi:hypothetical protein
LERDCKLIVVSDNGQDGAFDFLDLEILMRTARIDAGFEIEILSAAATEKFVGIKAARHFFNMAGTKWREAARDRNANGFALLMSARKIDPNQLSQQKADRHIIWLKPCVFGDMPLDISSYAEANPDFPHQSTIDQFFDEQQWESHRRLGYEMGARIFSTRHGIWEDIVPSVHKSRLD